MCPGIFPSAASLIASSSLPPRFDGCTLIRRVRTMPEARRAGKALKIDHDAPGSLLPFRVRGPTPGEGITMGQLVQADKDRGSGTEAGATASSAADQCWFECGDFHFTCRNRDEFARICQDVFRDHEYAFETRRWAPLIIDAGAHVGAATHYFKWRYPRARVLAIE